MEDRVENLCPNVDGLFLAPSFFPRRRGYYQVYVPSDDDWHQSNREESDQVTAISVVEGTANANGTYLVPAVDDNYLDLRPVRELCVLVWLAS
jgi:hypothetical protein